MITELYLSHYKSITEDTIKLGSKNIFVGKNGSGKSNIVDAISFLADVATDDLDYAVTKRHGADSVRQWSKFKPFHTTVAAKLKSDHGEGLYSLVFTSSRNGYRIQEEVLTWEGERISDYEQHTSVLRRDGTGVVTLQTNYDRENGRAGKTTTTHEIEALRSDPGESVIYKIGTQWSESHELFGYVPRELRSFSLFTIFPNTIRSPQSVSRAAELESDGKNIASIIKQMTAERRRNRDRIIRALKAVLPQLAGISIRSAAGYYVPVFSVIDPSGDAHELNMSQISDGTLRMLGILTAIHQPRAPLKIALEEPEQMVHPALLIIVRDAVEEFIRRRKNSQVFITTHSSALMDLFDIEDIIAVEYVKGSTHSGRISERQSKVIKSGLMTLGDLMLAEDLEVA